MSRTRLIVLLGGFALLVALVPVVVHHAATRQRGTLDAAPHLVLAATAGRSAVTPAMKAEIQRVVADAPRLPTVARKLVAAMRPAVMGTGGKPLAQTQADDQTVAPMVAQSLAQSLVRCATFDGQRYCLGEGWTQQTPAQVRSSIVGAMGQQAGPQTGDLSPLQAMLRQAALSPSARAAAESAELTQAAQSVAKVWLLRHQLQGVPLPKDFLQKHPEAAVPAGSTTTAGSATGSGAMALSAATTRARRAAYPTSYKILSPKRVSAQQRTYWCGVASMQMIGWNWSHHKRTQRHWAGRLRTTTDGTATSDMVRVINQDTGWGNKWHAGPYIVLDVRHWTYTQWWRLIEKHISKYHAPVVLNPMLLKKYFPYLDHDESGHFQVGRGYKRRYKSYNLIGYFEPFNQQQFDPSEPYIARVQWRSAYRSYLANEANSLHEIGV